MNTLSQAEYCAVQRHDLASFIQRCFYELNPQTPFLWNWHIDVMAAKLAACQRGEIKRLIINIPPRHLKSLCASVALPAWWLGHDPTAQLICVSYGQDLADKLARDCRSIMTAPWYQRVFATRLSEDKQSVQEFATTQQGFRFATSVGGVLTGRGGDIIIIDDPMKPDEALSETQRQKTNDWYSHTLLSRLNSKKDGCMILIMQRLHEDDLVGHVTSNEHWDVLSFPAISEQEESYEIKTIFGARRYQRRVGDVLHAEREPAATLEHMRGLLGPYNFAGQYQQAPVPLGGGLVLEKWFRRYGPNELPPKFDQIVQSWDTANKPTELSDYSVCSTWGVREKRLYLLNVLRKRLDYPNLKRAVRQQWQDFSATVILIEDKASGTQLIQELIEDGVHAVKRYTPDCDKIMRLHAQTGTIENGFVYLPDAAHWLGDYLHELTSFPKGKYDDQVDSTSQALDWLKQRPPGWGLLEWMRIQAEEARLGQTGGPPIQLRVPVGISHLYTFTGRQICVPADRTVSVSEEDARPLVAAGCQRILM